MARPSLVRHRKFRRALNALRIPRAHLLGHLEILWHSAYEVGHDLVGDALDVELAAEWEGERGAFARALTEAGFLVEEGGVYHVHDLLDNAPGYVKDRWKKREKRAAEKAKRSDPSEERRDKSSTVPDKSGTVEESLPVPLSPTPTPIEKSPNGDMSAKPTRSRYSEEIKEVWRAWLGTQPEKSRDRFKLTDQRRSKIRARLSRDGCSLQDLLDAVRGWPLDDWEGRRAANAIEILLRDRGQVEKFSKLYRERNGGLPEGWSVL